MGFFFFFFIIFWCVFDLLMRKQAQHVYVLYDQKKKLMFWQLFLFPLKIVSKLR